MTIFQTIHTTYGLQRMAAAEAIGVPINLTHMAVGDGNGKPANPDPEQTHLVRELYRGLLNDVVQDPDEPTRFTAELVLPSDIGGFTQREVGIFDSEGGLFAVGNLPATYKPLPSEGAFGDGVVRMEFLVTNATVVTMQVDPNVVVATRTWITNHVTAASLIPGGTAGQLLSKASNEPGNFAWVDLEGVNVTVDVVEEKQVLAAAQTVVTLAVTTTRGLAVYVGGQRISKGAGVEGWTAADAGTSLTKIVLGKAYPEGTGILLTQNEPTGSAPAPLERSQNLADLGDKAAARSNLGVYSKAEVDQKAPPGMVAYFARRTAPTGWLKANGAEPNRKAYAALFEVIGTTFGAGDGFNTFRLPDLRGEFIRGLDDGRGLDPDRELGVAQGDQLGSHTHTGTTVGALGAGYQLEEGRGNPDYGLASIGHTGGNETRPHNQALLACIKY